MATLPASIGVQHHLAAFLVARANFFIHAAIEREAQTAQQANRRAVVGTGVCLKSDDAQLRLGVLQGSLGGLQHQALAVVGGQEFKAEFGHVVFGYDVPEADVADERVGRIAQGYCPVVPAVVADTRLDGGDKVDGVLQFIALAAVLVPRHVGVGL